MKLNHVAPTRPSLERQKGGTLSFIYLIHGLFHDTISSSDYIASNNRLIIS